jgi:hypothetical protein
MDSAFGKSLKKYEENMYLLLETIKRSNYENMSIIYVAYLDSIGWNFDGPALDRELLYGMDSPLAKTLSAYHEGLRPPREPTKRSRNMELFRVVEKEYLDSLDPKEPEPVEFPNKHFCSEGHRHQLIDIDGERTCRECGLIVGKTRYVSGYGCWDRAIMRSKPATIESKVYGFIRRKGVSGYELFRGRGSSDVVNMIVAVCESEKSSGVRLPNLNIISYQVCKRLGVEADWSLLKIPKGEAPHNRCRKIFEKLGWDYVE